MCSQVNVNSDISGQWDLDHLDFLIFKNLVVFFFFYRGFFSIYNWGKDILISESITNKFNFAEEKIIGLFLPGMVL